MQREPQSLLRVALGYDLEKFEEGSIAVSNAATVGDDFHCKVLWLDAFVKLCNGPDTLS